MALTSRALAFASRWFDEATVRRTFEPLIADWQREWQDTPASRRWWVSVRAMAAFVCAAMVSSPAVIRAAVPSATSRRIATRIATFVGVATSLLMIQSAMTFPAEGLPMPFVVFLIPSAMTVAFPFAMALAVDAIRRRDPMPPQVERAAALKLALFAVAFVLIFGGWVVPAANQIWRVKSVQSGMLQSTYPNAKPSPGVRELTTFELLLDPSRGMAYEWFSGSADRPTRVRRELSKRAVLTLLPILLLWLRWRSHDLPCRRWVRPLPALASTIVTIVAFFSLYYLGWRMELEWKLASGIGYWLSIAAFAIWGMTAPYFRRQLVAMA